MENLGKGPPDPGMYTSDDDVKKAVEALREVRHIINRKTAEAALINKGWKPKYIPTILDAAYGAKK